MNNLIYSINERPKTFKELLLFSLQMVLSVFVATTLIAVICGVNVSAALVGAGLSTIVYLIFTKFQSPMFISNSGAFVAPVLMALAVGGYTAVAVGGLTTAIVYCIFGVIFSRVPVDNIYKVFPKALIGAVTVCIGINLMGFINTYVQVNGETSQWGVVIALITTLVVALLSHYAKGLLRILPFLVGTLVGYGAAVVITLMEVVELVDFSVFKNIGLFCMPEFAFTKFTNEPITALIPVIIIYIAYTISAMMECLSDHAALGNIIGVDLYRKPSLHRIFCGEGIANIASSFFGGLGACSYGESVACIGFSRVASTWVTATSAIMLALLGFIAPIQAFIASIPSCVFAGDAIILYGFIACSGIRLLQDVDLNNQKNLIIVSAVISIGVCGIVLGNNNFTFSGTALALIVGVVLNLFLEEKTN